jgi:hypothetical protein
VVFWQQIIPPAGKVFLTNKMFFPKSAKTAAKIHQKKTKPAPKSLDFLGPVFSFFDFYGFIFCFY